MKSRNHDLWEITEASGSVVLEKTTKGTQKGLTCGKMQNIIMLIVGGRLFQFNTGAAQ